MNGDWRRYHIGYLWPLKLNMRSRCTQASELLPTHRANGLLHLPSCNITSRSLTAKPCDCFLELSRTGSYRFAVASGSPQREPISRPPKQQEAPLLRSGVAASKPATQS